MERSLAFSELGRPPLPIEGNGLARFVPWPLACVVGDFFINWKVGLFVESARKEHVPAVNASWLLGLNFCYRVHFQWDEFKMPDCRGDLRMAQGGSRRNML